MFVRVYTGLSTWLPLSKEDVLLSPENKETPILMCHGDADNVVGAVLCMCGASPAFVTRRRQLHAEHVVCRHENFGGHVKSVCCVCVRVCVCACVCVCVCVCTQVQYQYGRASYTKLATAGATVDFATYQGMPHSACPQVRVCLCVCVYMRVHACRSLPAHGLHAAGTSQQWRPHERRMYPRKRYLTLRTHRVCIWVYLCARHVHPCERYLRLLAPCVMCVCVCACVCVCVHRSSRT